MSITFLNKIHCNLYVRPAILREEGLAVLSDIVEELLRYGYKFKSKRNGMIQKPALLQAVLAVASNIQPIKECGKIRYVYNYEDNPNKLPEKFVGK